MLTAAVGLLGAALTAAVPPADDTAGGMRIVLSVLPPNENASLGLLLPAYWSGHGPTMLQTEGPRIAQYASALPITCGCLSLPPSPSGCRAAVRARAAVLRAAVLAAAYLHKQSTRGVSLRWLFGAADR